jgi:hypothetical protein
VLSKNLPKKNSIKTKDKIMKKTSILKQAAAALMATVSLVATPEQVKSNEINSQNQIASANKKATLSRFNQNQGIKISDRTGGLDFQQTRMIAYPSPIYIPYYHKKQTYRAQVRKANKRKNK